RYGDITKELVSQFRAATHLPAGDMVDSAAAGAMNDLLLRELKLGKVSGTLRDSTKTEGAPPVHPPLKRSGLRVKAYPNFTQQAFAWDAVTSADDTYTIYADLDDSATRDPLQLQMKVYTGAESILIAT